MGPEKLGICHTGNKNTAIFFEYLCNIAKSKCLVYWPPPSQKYHKKWTLQNQYPAHRRSPQNFYQTKYCFSPEVKHFGPQFWLTTPLPANQWKMLLQSHLTLNTYTLEYECCIIFHHYSSCIDIKLVVFAIYLNHYVKYLNITSAGCWLQGSHFSIFVQVRTEIQSTKSSGHLIDWWKNWCERQECSDRKFLCSKSYFVKYV